MKYQTYCHMLGTQQHSKTSLPLSIPHKASHNWFLYLQSPCPITTTTIIMAHIYRVQWVRHCSTYLTQVCIISQNPQIISLPFTDEATAGERLSVMLKVTVCNNRAGIWAQAGSSKHCLCLALSTWWAFLEFHFYPLTLLETSKWVWCL